MEPEILIRINTILKQYWVGLIVLSWKAFLNVFEIGASGLEGFRMSDVFIGEKIIIIKIKTLE